jgi:hypothetical protein
MLLTVKMPSFRQNNAERRQKMNWEGRRKGGGVRIRGKFRPSPPIDCSESHPFEKKTESDSQRKNGNTYIIAE